MQNFSKVIIYLLILIATKNNFGKTVLVSSSPSMVPYRDGFFLGGAIDATTATLLPSPFQPDSFQLFSDQSNITPH